MAEFEWLLRGRREVVGESLDIPFVVRDCDSVDEARTVAQENAPSTQTGGYVLTNTGIEISEYYTRTRHCKGTARYVYDDDEANGNGVSLPDDTDSFDYTGGQMFVQTALSTTTGTPSEGYEDKVPNDDSRPLINFNEDTNAIDGITLPLLNDVVAYNCTRYYREAGFGWSNIRSIYENRYKTNSAAWGSLSIGEVLFLGASGSLSGDAGKRIWTVNYRIAIGANRTAAEDIVTGYKVTKNAHDYVEVWFRRKLGTDGIFKKPSGVKIHRVYNAFDLSTILPSS